MKIAFKRIIIIACAALLLTGGVGQAFAGSAFLNGIGSRGTVTASAPMYGGFQLTASTAVYIVVRGPSLQTLGITSNPLFRPSLRVYDAWGRDILVNNFGGNYSNICSSTGAIAFYYAAVRGQPLDLNEPCVGLSLPAGAYTFSITPSAGNPSQSGEVLFEVTLNP